MQQQAAHAEPAFVQERAREYGKRLQKAAHAICLKHAAASTTAGSPSEPGTATTTGSAPMADLSGSKAELEKVLYGLAYLWIKVIIYELHRGVICIVPINFFLCAK